MCSPMLVHLPKLSSIVGCKCRQLTGKLSSGQKFEKLFCFVWSQKVIYCRHCVGDYHAKTIYIHTENADSVTMPMCIDYADYKKNYSKCTTNNVGDSIKNFFAFCIDWQRCVIFFFHFHMKIFGSFSKIIMAS